MSQTGLSDRASDTSAGSRRNRRLALSLGLFAAAMVGVSFAAVPLYRLFCAATGYGGTPQRSSSLPQRLAEETITLRFDANVAPGLPWTFAPEENEITFRIGENKLAFFRATNRSAETVTGTAAFNVTPDLMGAYFTKVQCFCFEEQTLKPGETVEMPVSFYVDPAVLEDADAKGIRAFTLSYTFFRARNSGAAALDPSKRALGVPQRNDATGG